jgi:hypothetical protein
VKKSDKLELCSIYYTLFFIYCKHKKTTEALIDASKMVGLEVNAEETKYILLSPHQNAGQYHDIKIQTDFLK